MAIKRADMSQDLPSTIGANLTVIGRYSAAVRKNAVEAVDQRRIRNPRDRSIFREVALEFGVGEQSLRLWVKRHDTLRLNGSLKATGRAPLPADADDSGLVPDQALAQRLVEDEIKALRQQVQKLRAENDILKRAFVMFSSEWEKADPPAG